MNVPNKTTDGKARHARSSRKAVSSPVPEKTPAVGREEPLASVSWNEEGTDLIETPSFSELPREADGRLPEELPRGEAAETVVWPAENLPALSQKELSAQTASAQTDEVADDGMDAFVDRLPGFAAARSKDGVDTAAFAIGRAAPGSPSAPRKAAAEAGKSASPRRQKANRPPKSHRVRRIVLRTLSVLGTTILCVALFLLGVTYVMCKGPSVSARNLFVSSVRETSALKWLPNLFFSEEEVKHILAQNSVLDNDKASTGEGPFVPPDPTVPLDTIEIVDVVGPTYTGKMMIVHDPSRIKVGCLDYFSANRRGKKIEEFVKTTGAVAAVNGGGFSDAGGVGKGGMPTGLVIKDGKIVFGNEWTQASVVAFDDNNRLYVGKMSGKQCLEKNIRDALSYGPAFIIDGEPVEVVGDGGGLNPRTVVGQRADGAVLLLVIEGRQPHSLGASYKDCIEVMMNFGAINAGNLDGGSSSMMIYNNEPLTSSASMYGSRGLPTVLLVM